MIGRAQAYILDSAINKLHDDDSKISVSLRHRYP
jgi:hypothetical protein